MILKMKKMPLLIWSAYAGIITAAPLDTFLETHLGGENDRQELEISFDHSITSQQFKSGDYRGWHLRGTRFLTDQIRIDGSYWKRNLDTGANWTDLSTWQVGAQWQFLNQDGMQPALALRYSLWNDKTDLLTKASFTFQKTKVTNIRVNNVDDRQHQINLIASWRLNHDWESPRWQFNLFSGYGKSRVQFADVVARYKGSDYHWSSPDDHSVMGTSDIGDLIYFEDKEMKAPGPDMDIAYDASYFQIGTNLIRATESWYFRIGYQFQSLDRAVDETVLESGKQAYKTNHIFLTEFGYSWNKNWLAFMNLQYLKNQTVGELPLLYNAYTSNRFEKDYGLASAGIRFSF